MEENKHFLFFSVVKLLRQTTSPAKMELSAEGNGVEVDAVEMVGEEGVESDENYESEDDAYELTESKDNTLVDMCVKVLGRHLGDAEWCGRFATSLATSFLGAK